VSLRESLTHLINLECKGYPTVISFDPIPACDGRTEQTDTPLIAKSRSSIADALQNLLLATLADIRVKISSVAPAPDVVSATAAATLARLGRFTARDMSLMSLTFNFVKCSQSFSLR